MASVLNFIKIYQLVQKLIGAERQDDLISLHFSFRKESRLKASIDSENIINRLEFLTEMPCVYSDVLWWVSFLEAIKIIL
jgi:hypothetical protein